jgi:hypothetical protein
LLVGFDAAESHARVVIDGHVHIFPAGAIGGDVAIAGHAVSWAPDRAQLLDVQMQQVTGRVVLIAQDRCTRLQRRQAIETGTSQ